MTELDTRTVVDPELDHGDGEPKFSHYVKKDSIMLSAIEGTPSEALCGKKWVPSRDPKKYPVCPTCKEMLEMLKMMD